MLLVASKVWGSAGLLVSIASESDTNYWDKLPPCCLLTSTRYSSLRKCMASLWMADSAYMTSHVIMPYLLWPPPASLACLSGPVAVLKGGHWLCIWNRVSHHPDKCKQVRIFSGGEGGGGGTVGSTQKGQTSGSGSPIKY